MEALSLSNGVALAIDRVAQNHPRSRPLTNNYKGHGRRRGRGRNWNNESDNFDHREYGRSLNRDRDDGWRNNRNGGNQWAQNSNANGILYHGNPRHNPIHRIIVHRCSQHHQIPPHFNLMSLANNVERMVIILVFSLYEATMPTQLITQVLPQTQLIGVSTPGQPTTCSCTHQRATFIRVLILSLLVTGLTFVLCILGMESYAHHRVHCILKRSYVFQPFGKIYYLFEDFVMIMTVISS